MDIERLCAGIKERVALELQETWDPATRQELLIAALIDIGCVVFPALGQPDGLRGHQELRDPVLELVSYVAVPLVREGDRRAAAALLELAADCPDPVLERKLSAWAKELTAKAATPRPGVFPARTKILAQLTGIAAVAPLALYLLSTAAEPEARRQQPEPRKETERKVKPGTRFQERAPSLPRAQEGDGGRNSPVDEAAPQRQEKAAPAVSVASYGAPVTKVRVVNDQVLVPVTLRQGGATVRLELLLDTGATRTAVHETVAGRLQIDLRSARPSLAELADGRVIRSRVAKVETMEVGPYAHGSMEVELIQYSGGSGMHDGLLGMDFLGRHRYQIDMEHEVIRWF